MPNSFSIRRKHFVGNFSAEVITNSMTKETFAKASKVVDKPLNVKIDIHLCTNIYIKIFPTSPYGQGEA